MLGDILDDHKHSHLLAAVAPCGTGGNDASDLTVPLASQIAAARPFQPEHTIANFQWGCFAITNATEGAVNRSHTQVGNRVLILTTCDC